MMTTSLSGLTTRKWTLPTEIGERTSLTTRMAAIHRTVWPYGTRTISLGMTRDVTDDMVLSVNDFETNKIHYKTVKLKFYFTEAKNP